MCDSNTETALLRIYNDLTLAMNKQRVSALVLLDLSAAFDTIDHNILLSRLNSYFGISNPAFSLLSSYLSNRSQSVVVNYEFSSKLPLLRGVQQGSVPNCLYFMVYSRALCQAASTSWCTAG